MSPLVNHLPDLMLKNITLAVLERRGESFLHRGRVAGSATAVWSTRTLIVDYSHLDA